MSLIIHKAYRVDLQVRDGLDRPLQIRHQESPKRARTLLLCAIRYRSISGVHGLVGSALPLGKNSPAAPRRPLAPSPPPGSNHLCPPAQPYRPAGATAIARTTNPARRGTTRRAAVARACRSPIQRRQAARYARKQMRRIEKHCCFSVSAEK